MPQDKIKREILMNNTSKSGFEQAGAFNTSDKCGGFEIIIVFLRNSIKKYLKFHAFSFKITQVT